METAVSRIILSFRKGCFMKEDIVYIHEYDGRTPVSITRAGISYCDGSYYIARRGTSQMVLEYVVSGRGVLVIDGIHYHPETGDVYIVPPNSDHYYASDRDFPWHKVWFNVDGTLLPDLLAAYGLTNSILLKGCPFRETFEAGLRELRESESEIPEVLSARIIVPLFAALGRFAGESREAASPAREVYRYISALRPEAVLNSKKLLRKSGRSVSQTIRIFKKEFGTTPYASFLAHKIKTAKYLLKSTSCPVKEIAFSLGWNNPCYFARLFKKKTGMTPGEYRASSPPPMIRSGYHQKTKQEDD